MKTSLSNLKALSTWSRISGLGFIEDRALDGPASEEKGSSRTGSWIRVQGLGS